MPRHLHGLGATESEARAEAPVRRGESFAGADGRVDGYHGTALLEQIEGEAQLEGVDRLRTEASQLSRPLLESRGWRVVAPETISIGGVPFERYRMDKPLRQS